jgi:hypothetical protein
MGNFLHLQKIICVLTCITFVLKEKTMKKLISAFTVVFILSSLHNIYSQIIYPPHCDTLLWGKVVNATSYRVQVANNVFTIIYSAMATDTHYVVPPAVMIGGNTYNMRVKPFFNADSGSWTNYYNFVFYAHPAPPVYLGLTDSTSLTPTLFWGRVPIASTYRLQIYLSQDTSNAIFDRSNIPDTFCTVGPLSYNIMFYVRLRSSNACGSGFSSVLLHFSLHPPIGIKKLSNEVPEKFELFQNYPNPFNPSTKIKFDIPVKSVGQTFLSVYDILGREVATLVNEKLNPGTYEVEWNASNYPSGVYFYKLETGNFTETKRMMLIK